MKPKSMKTILLAALLAPGALFAQTTATTTPVGYVTSSLGANQFNLVSITMHQPLLASGVIDSESSNSVTDNEVNFTTLLSAGTTYVLELPNGLIQEVTGWSQNTLTTSNITASVVPGTTTYKLRKASTISDIFGATNQSGITPSTDGDLTACDLIQIYNGAGFDTIYYYNDGTTQGWFTDANDAAANFPVVYSDAIFVKRVAGSSINLVISGEVKTQPTSGVLSSGFNYLSGVAPTGLTLANSGLNNFITNSADGDLSTADTVLLPTTSGSYTTCYYFNDGTTTGWFTDANDPADNLPISSGIIIQNIGSVKPYTISVPSTYSTL